MFGFGTKWINTGCILMAVASPTFTMKVAKADFPKFVGVIGCEEAGDSCPGASLGFVSQGLAGEGDFQDPSAANLAKGGKVVMGFLEGKPFSWSRYSVDYPNVKTKWVILNELTVGEGNRSFLTEWKSLGQSWECIKIESHYFSIALGEMIVHAKSTLPDGSLLMILKGEGSDAGVNLQDFRMVRIQSKTNAIQVVDQHTNRSEIPLQKILDKLNSDQEVEPVTDSVLSCELKGGKKAPSGFSWLRFIKSKNQVLYTKSGPVETPISKDTTLVDIWKTIRDFDKGSAKRPR